MPLRRRVTAVAAALAAALLVTACGGGGGDEQAARTVTLDWGDPENPLVPGNTTEQNGGDVIGALFAGLVRYDVDTAQPVLEAAQAIDTTDNQTFTIRLEPGWTFHDGTPVTARNYVDAWNWTAYGPNAAQAQSFMERIQGYDQVSSEQPTAQAMTGLQVVDPQTFTVTLEQPFTIFPTTSGTRPTTRCRRRSSRTSRPGRRGRSATASTASSRARRTRTSRWCATTSTPGTPSRRCRGWSSASTPSSRPPTTT